MTETPLCQTGPHMLRAHEIHAGRRVCRMCEARLDRELGEVVQLWALLPGRLEKGRNGPSPSGGTAPGSQPPVNLGVLSLLAGGAGALLLVEEDAWRRELRRTEHYPLTPRRPQDEVLTGTVRWLREALNWACHAYPDVDDLHTTLRLLLGQMRPLATGERPAENRLGVACPMPPRGADGEQDAVTCGGVLTYEPPRTVRCSSCHRAVPLTAWDQLAAAAGLLTLPGVA